AAGRARQAGLAHPRHHPSARPARRARPRRGGAADRAGGTRSRRRRRLDRRARRGRRAVARHPARLRGADPDRPPPRRGVRRGHRRLARRPDGTPGGRRRGRRLAGGVARLRRRRSGGAAPDRASRPHLAQRRGRAAFLPALGRCAVRDGGARVRAGGGRGAAHRHGPRRRRRAARRAPRRRHDDRPGRGELRRLRHAARGGRARRRPRSAAARRDRPGARPAVRGAGPMSEILVVDDSLTVRMNLAETLTAAGFAVTACATLGEARRELAAGAFALVILDVLLPDGDGIELLAELRAAPPTAGIAVIVLSSESEVRDRVRELIGRAPPPGETGDLVLVIDDSPSFCAALAEALEAAGYRAAAAGSGEEGLRRAAELRALESGADAFARKEEDVAILLARLAAILRNAAPPQAPQAPVSLHAPKKLLAVDDSETHLQALAERLRGEGYEVVPARSGEEALDLLAVEPVDCILLDVMMPGLGGEETCRRIKAAAATRDTPIIMLTARDDRAAMLQGLAAGADDYIAKSADFEVLRARLLAQLRRRQFEDENRTLREELLRREMAAAEARAAHELAATRAALVEELERKNRELEAFSYSVSHDLRAPLRGIDGFSQALLEDYGAALPPPAQDYLRRVRAAAQRMGELIDDLLQLSRVGRAPLQRRRIDLSALARSVVA